MAFIGSMLGAGQGTGFTAANSPIAPNAVTQEQINASYGHTQDGLAQQQSFLNALQAQNGVQNQTNVYNQLQGVANGTGPNPAQAMLAQSTGANVANQSALMAGQRGASQNVGMIARQAAQQGANIQQQAAGQAASMQANQSINAIGQMGGLASQQVSQQGQATQGYNQLAQGEQQNLLGANAAYQTAQAGINSNVNQTNSASAIQNSKAQQGLFGGLLGGSGAFLSDENTKTNITDASGKIQSFLDNLGSHEYEYKDSMQGKPGTSPGRHTGPMAQELEKSELGQQMVINTPQGKGVDFQRGLGTILAAQAALNKRLEALEGGGKSAAPVKMAEGGPVQQPMTAQQPGSMTAPQPLAPAFVPPPTMPMPQNQAGSIAGRFLQGATNNMEQQAQQSSPADSGGIQSGANTFAQNAGRKFLGLGKDETVLGNLMGKGSIDQAVAIPQNGQPSMGSVTSQPIAPESYSAVEPAGGEAAAAGEAVEGADAAAGAATAAEGAEGVEALGSLGEAAVLLAKGGKIQGKVPALVSPGEVYLSPSKVAKVAKEGNKPGKALKEGEKIPGKAKVAGNSYDNDTVSKTLSEGGIVIPREAASDPQKAAAFVQALLMKQGGRQNIKHGKGKRK